MKKWEKGKYIMLGIVLTLMVSAIVTPAFATLSSKTIEVLTGVNIYIDDVKLNPTDVNGNPVEAFIYNGTTYLPVRAIGEALEKTVQWEGETNSVYLGAHESNTPAVWLKDLDYFYGKDWGIDTDKQDNLGNSYENAIKYYCENTYLLNGQYTKITGTFFQQYAYKSSSSVSTLEIYGDGKLLYEAEMSGGVQPAYFDIDLTGVLELQIKLDGDYVWGTSHSSLGDCGLWT